MMNCMSHTELGVQSVWKGEVELSMLTGQIVQRMPSHLLFLGLASGGISTHVSSPFNSACV